MPCPSKAHASACPDLPWPGTEVDIGDPEASLEGWLQTPLKQNIRRHGWKKLYIVVSTKKIIMFNSEQDRQNSDPTLILDLNKVTGDVSVPWWPGDLCPSDSCPSTSCRCSTCAP